MPHLSDAFCVFGGWVDS